MTTVGLVQINQGFSGQGYFPYSVGLLEAHARAHLTRPEECRFLLPLFQRLPLDQAAQHLAEADVLGVSLYVWNFEYSMALVRRYRELRPDGLVIVGGPHVPDSVAQLPKHEHGRLPIVTGEPTADRTESFLLAHPYVDAAVHGEGERAFTAILERPDRWREAPSVSFLEDGVIRRTSRGERLKALDEIPSPYLSGTFDALIAANPDHRWIAMWETNRGCPFSCAFCDWGSAVAAKVHRWADDRLFGEVEWFAAHRIEFVFCADANFGILPRDVDIARHVAAVKQRTGYPTALSVQSTKNAEHRSFEVQKVLSDAGLNKGVVVSMQSLDPRTLKDIKRDNISLDSFQNVQRRFTEAGIETMSDLILGLPGETYETFVSGVARLVDLGQHNRIQFNNLSILPNAEMGDPAYQRRHGMEIVRSRIINIHGEKQDDEIDEFQDLVVATTAMPRADWIRARTFAWTAGLLHFDKLFQIPLIVAHEIGGVSYRDLLTLFAARQPEHAGRFPTLDRVREFFVAKARDIQNGGEEYCYSPDWLGIWWPADEHVLIDLVTSGQLAAFYREAEALLEEHLLAAGVALPEGLLHDCVDLNHRLVKLPFQQQDVDVATSYNVWEFYQAVLRGTAVTLAADGHQYRVDRTSSTWPSLQQWCREVVWWGNKKGAYLYGNAAIGREVAGHF
jgi:radical SAM superfamily enzyme YgiQ (UPF0313 family)